MKNSQEMEYFLQKDTNRSRKNLDIEQIIKKNGWEKVEIDQFANPCFFSFNFGATKRVKDKVTHQYLSWSVYCLRKDIDKVEWGIQLMIITPTGGWIAIGHPKKINQNEVFPYFSFKQKAKSIFFGGKYIFFKSKERAKSFLKTSEKFLLQLDKYIEVKKSEQ